MERRISKKQSIVADEASARATARRQQLLDPFVVVTGAPRSGTYLTVTQLERHFSIAIPLETHFIPLFGMWKFLWGDLSKRDNRQALVEDIYAFLGIWAKASRVTAPEMRGFNLLVTRDYAEQIIDSTTSYDEIVQSMFSYYASTHHKTLAGEKSAFYSLIPLSWTTECFGDSARVLHVTRDGRDVARSWMSMWTGPETLTSAALMWKGHVQQKRQWGKRNPDRYLEVRYEEMLSDPARINSEISSFLGVESTDAQPQQLSQVLSTLPTHQQIGGDLNRNNSFKWRTEMGVGERKIFEYHAGDVLADFDYDKEGFSYSIADHLHFALLRVGSTFVQMVSIRRWKNRIKTILPLLLWLSRKVRLRDLLLRLAD